MSSSTERLTKDVPQSAGEGADTGARWRDLRSPLRGPPSFLFGKGAREVFEKYYVTRLDEHEKTFARDLAALPGQGPDLEERVLEDLPQVVARDAWREAFSAWSNSFLFAASLVSGAVSALSVPWLIASGPWWYMVLACVVGLVGDFLLLLALVAIDSLFISWRLDSLSGLLTLAALSLGTAAWLSAEKPAAWLFFMTPTLAFGVTMAGAFLAECSILCVTSSLKRQKTVKYLHAELCDELMSVLRKLHDTPVNYADVAWSFSYMADVVERNWRYFHGGGDIASATLLQVRGVARGISGGMRRNALSACFPAVRCDDGEDFDVHYTNLTARQCVAIARRRYGDLPVVAVEADESVRPRVRRLLRGLGSVVAAVLPLALLIVLPRLFDFTVSPDLNGTLFTVSLVWLALSVVGWLDPQSLNRVSSTTGVVGAMRSARPGS